MPFVYTHILAGGLLCHSGNDIINHIKMPKVAGDVKCPLITQFDIDNTNLRVQVALHLPKLIFSIIVPILLLLSSHCFAVTKPLSLVAPDKVVPLKGNQGYLLMNLDVNGTAPSFEFAMLRKGQAFLTADQKAIRKTRKNHRKIVIDLKNKPNGFYLLNLPPGLYQITRIYAPYFNLPYRLDTEYKRDWRFSIQQGKVNYIGKLFINNERSTKYVDVKLLNRIATDKDTIETLLSDLLTIAPLNSGAGVRDDFFEQLTTRYEE